MLESMTWPGTRHLIRDTLYWGMRRGLGVRAMLRGYHRTTVACPW